MEQLPEPVAKVSFQISINKRIGGYIVESTELGKTPMVSFRTPLSKVVTFGQAHTTWLTCLKNLLEGGYFKITYAPANFGKMPLKFFECIAVLVYHESKVPLLDVLKGIIKND